MMAKTTKAQWEAAAIGARDAYSWNRYTDAGWMQIAKRLADEGASPAEIDWTLRSKHMRWAADHANRSHSVTAADFADYVHYTFQRKPAEPWQALLIEVRKDLAKHAPKPATGADLAGACEGEQIAALIDFARTVRDETSPSGERGDAERQLAILRDKAARILAAIEARAK